MTLAPGFQDPVHDAQGCFRAVMDAFARPALARNLVTSLTPPAPLAAELAAIALSLADHDAPLWLDASLARSAAVREFLRFHTGAPIVERPEEAVFALVADAPALPELSTFAQGSDAYPDRSATILIAVEDITDGPEGLLFAGPGVKGQARLAVLPEPPSLAVRIEANAALFPRGVDLLFASPGRIVALPRSARIVKAN